MSVLVKFYEQKLLEDARSSGLLAGMGRKQREESLERQLERYEAAVGDYEPEPEPEPEMISFSELGLFNVR